MVKLTQLELQNFFSHVNTSLDLEDYRGLVLIEGQNQDGHYSSNGSGKSTLLEGIVYALTGDTLRGVSVNDVVNRNYKKNTRVSLHFNTHDTNYEVSRYRKDDKYGDSLLLVKEGEDISKRVNKETQQLLDDILNISYKVLVSTMLLGEGLSSRFTQLSDPEKKSLIESTLNLNYDISTIRAKANNMLSSSKEKKSNIAGRLSAMREYSNIDISELEKELDSNSTIVAQASKELESLKASLGELQASRVPLEQKLQLLSSSLMKHDSLNSELKRLDNENMKYHEELLNMEKSECPHCTVCHQNLESEESKEAFRESYREKIEAITSKMMNITAEIQSLPDRSILDSKYQEISTELQGLSQRINDINTRINNINSEYWRATNREQSLNDTIKNHNSAINDITSLESEERLLSADIEKYEYFYKLFSPTGIIVNILSDAIEYINTRLRTYSEILLEKDYHIDFVKGKISLVDSKGSSYQSLSNGEKRRLDISIQFALHDYCTKYCGFDMDTLFIDEIMDTLDDIGIENIITVLRLKLEYCNLSRILVISHNSALKSHFDNIITVKKDANGDSKVAQC